MPLPPTEVRAAHLLVKHSGSRNPISRRTNKEITLTPEDALDELRQYQKLIVKEGLDSFPKYAAGRSDCSSYKVGGDLGFFGRGQMQQPFEEAAFGLQPGQMTSEICSTDSGYHLIYRIQ